MITYGHIRDAERLRKIKGFNVWCKGFDPSYMRQTILTNYNIPIRIGKAVVIPGDVVLAKSTGVLFIPSHLVEHIVMISSFTKLSDEFGEEMIRNKVYTAGEIDSAWDEKMNDKFKKWLLNYPKELPVNKELIIEYLAKRNF